MKWNVLVAFPPCTFSFSFFAWLPHDWYCRKLARYLSSKMRTGRQTFSLQCQWKLWRTFRLILFRYLKALWKSALRVRPCYSGYTLSRLNISRLSFDCHRRTTRCSECTWSLTATWCFVWTWPLSDTVKTTCFVRACPSTQWGTKAVGRLEQWQKKMRPPRPLGNTSITIKK